MSRKFHFSEKGSNRMCVSILNGWMERYDGREKEERERMRRKRNGKIGVRKKRRDGNHTFFSE